MNEVAAYSSTTATGSKTEPFWRPRSHNSTHIVRIDSHRIDTTYMQGHMHTRTHSADEHTTTQNHVDFCHYMSTYVHTYTHVRLGKGERGEELEREKKNKLSDVRTCIRRPFSAPMKIAHMGTWKARDNHTPPCTHNTPNAHTRAHLYITHTHMRDQKWSSFKTSKLDNKCFIWHKHASTTSMH